MAHDSQLAAKLRGFGPVGIASLAIIILAALFVGPLAAILVIGWAWLAQVPRADLGFAPPRSWIATIAAGIVAGVLLKLVLKALIMPLLAAPSANPAYHFVTGNLPALLRMIVTVILVAGLGEEILYRGYLFERLQRLLGRGRSSTVAIIVISTGLFALAHLADQGVPGMEQSAITGLIFALMYVFSGSLWLSMVTHASFDIAALVTIYFDVEATVGKSVYG